MKKKRSQSKLTRKGMGIALIAEAAKLLRWGIAVPKEKQVRYLIIGEKKELDRIDRILAKKSPKIDMRSISNTSSSGSWHGYCHNTEAR